MFIEGYNIFLLLILIWNDASHETSAYLGRTWGTDANKEDEDGRNGATRQNWCSTSSTRSSKALCGAGQQTNIQTCTAQRIRFFWIRRTNPYQSQESLRSSFQSPSQYVRHLSLQQRPILYKRQSDTSSQGQGKKFGSPTTYLGCNLFVSFTTLFSFSSGRGICPAVFNGSNIFANIFFGAGGRGGERQPSVPKACSSYYPLFSSGENNRELDMSFSLTGTWKCTRETSEHLMWPGYTLAYAA